MLDVIEAVQSWDPSTSSDTHTYGSNFHYDKLLADYFLH